MKAFLAACLVVAGVSVIAGFGLAALDMTSSQSYSTDNVRLD